MAWASFADTHPTSRASEKAARKHQQRLLRRVAANTPGPSQEKDDDELVSDS